MRVAVIDVGSNSIKLLVASRGPGGRLVEEASRVLEVRIGGGLGSARPRLDGGAVGRAVAAIASLTAEARGLGADRVIAVATSAVRDASNSGEFLDRAKAATGLAIRILTGPEEAGLIGLGLSTDPALGDRGTSTYTTWAAAASSASRSAAGPPGGQSACPWDASA